MTTYADIVTSLVDDATASAAQLATAQPGVWYRPCQAALGTKHKIHAQFMDARAESEDNCRRIYDEPLDAKSASDKLNPPVYARAGTLEQAKAKIDFLMSIQKAFVARRKTRIAAAAEYVGVALRNSSIIDTIYNKRLQQLEQITARQLKPSTAVAQAQSSNDVVA